MLAKSGRIVAGAVQLAGAAERVADVFDDEPSRRRGKRLAGLVDLVIRGFQVGVSEQRVQDEQAFVRLRADERVFVPRPRPDAGERFEAWPKPRGSFDGGRVFPCEAPPG